MDIKVYTCVLPHGINGQELIKFINRYNVQDNGNITLMSEKTFNTLSRIGTVCSYVLEGNQIVGTVMSVSLTLNTGKSSYTTYLCVHPEHRHKDLARKLINTNIIFGEKMLKTEQGYYIGLKSRRAGSKINSWYRIINYDRMKNTGFGVLADEKMARLKYKIKRIDNAIVKKGFRTKDVVDSSKLIHWSPDKKELKRFSEVLNCYTIFIDNEPSAVFIISSLDCIIGKTNKKVTMAVLNYFYCPINDKRRCIKMIFNQVRDEGYDCLYGYVMSDITDTIISELGSHVTSIDFYLDFYNTYVEGINPRSINIPIF